MRRSRDPSSAAGAASFGMTEMGRWVFQRAGIWDGGDRRATHAPPLPLEFGVNLFRHGRPWDGHLRTGAHLCAPTGRGQAPPLR
jgi:hypothetical protein